MIIPELGGDVELDPEFSKNPLERGDDVRIRIVDLPRESAADGGLVFTCQFDDASYDPHLHRSAAGRLA